MLYFIGVGGFGGKIAQLISQKIKNSIPLIFSTSIEDTKNYGTNTPNEIAQIIKTGNGKNYLIGEKLWKDPTVVGKLQTFFNPIQEDDKVIIFGSTAGGSGSSSFVTLVNLIKAKDIAIVTTLPHEEAVNFEVNTYFCLNNLIALEKKASILIFSNAELFQKHQNNVLAVNEEIVSNTITTFLLKEIDNKGLKTVWSIDQRDYDEIVFKKGFVNLANTDKLSQKVFTFPVYGNLKLVKRFAIIYNVKEQVNEKELAIYAQEFQDEATKFLKHFGKTTIIHYGIVRSNQLQDKSYYIVGNGFSISPYLMKLKSKVATEVEKLKNIKEDVVVLEKEEKKTLDITNI